MKKVTQIKLQSSQIKFPIDILPEPFREFVEELSNVSPMDYAGVSLLATAGVAIGKTFKVKYGMYENYPSLYACIVGKTGINKTFPMNTCLTPINRQDKENHEKYSQLLREYEKAPFDSKPPKPHYLSFILRNFTPEALAKKHHQNQRGILVFRNELRGWLKTFDRYAKNGEEENYMDLWDGETLQVERKTDDTVYRLENPCVSILGSTQPEVVYDFAKGERKHSGFFNRFVFAMVEHGHTEQAPQELTTLERYNQKMSKILSFNQTNDFESIELHYSKEAFQFMESWTKQNQAKVLETDDNFLAGIYSKLNIYIHRFALILHVLEGATNFSDMDMIPKQIEMSTIRNAENLTEYFRYQSEQVYDKICNPDPCELLQGHRRLLYQILPERFITGQALQLANENSVSCRTTKRFLTDKRFFEKIKHGEYEKL